MQITHTLTSDFPELKAHFIYFVPEQSLFNYKMDLVLCHAVLYIEEFLTVGCVIVMLLAKRKLVYHVFLHVSNKGKNTQQ